MFAILLGGRFRWFIYAQLCDCAFQFSVPCVRVFDEFLCCFFNPFQSLIDVRQFFQFGRCKYFRAMDQVINAGCVCIQLGCLGLWEESFRHFHIPFAENQPKRVDFECPAQDYIMGAAFLLAALNFGDSTLLDPRDYFEVFLAVAAIFAGIF